nr:hypothetical protein [uncultured bacterium]
MTEVEFINAIDCLLNFNTKEEYEEATRIACFISDNAALMVGYELVSLSSHASLEINLGLLDIMRHERPTTVVLSAIPVIESLLKHEEPTSESVQMLLKASKEHGNAWNGLGIVECADESLEKSCEEIRQEWVKLQKETDNP